jgi:hypothetical protein
LHAKIGDMVHHRDNQGEFEETDPSRVILSPIASIRDRFSIRMTIGILCFVLSLFFYYGSVLRVQLKRTDLLDLGPYTDAVEYFAQANSILKGKAPAIQIGYDRLPSRYPPGYPILMLPWLKLLPHNKILAPFRTNQTIGLLLLIGGFVFYVGIGRPLAAGLTSLLLATQPAFISFTRSSMSDLSGATAAVLAFVLVYIGFRRARRWPIYCAAIVLGLSLCIRPQLFFFAPLLIAIALFPTDGSWTRWLMHCCLVVVVFALASLPYFLYNAFEFGNPLKTGYHFWVPDWAESASLFSVHNVPPQLAMLWSEITANWNEFRVANLFGTGTYFVPAFVLLAVLGLAFVRIDRFTVAAFLGGISYFVATLTYAFVDGRFYLPLFFLLVPLAILPGEWALSNALKLLFSLSTVAVLAVLMLTWLGYPSQSGFKPQKRRFQAWDALHYAKSGGMSPQYEAQKELAFSFWDAPGIVLSDTDSAYLNVLLPKPFVAAPIDEKHYYCYSRLWHYGKAEAIRLVTGGLDHAIPVYALFAPSEHLDQDVERLPQIQGYTWKRSDRSGTTAVIMVLTKETGASSLDAVPAQRG